ncbi:hypothetical protein KGF54_005315 [Candida jiufengensis]|uniref:uncharacterized protein n=1 Tax=Candida jiufengensis TaxID=497108 RepID=UPI002224D527|nr:uncharacterized protein KGF54_005315 [Candida jiufengensis]KAI5950167.1 hypothetical protein KGF54_005315 [Candida jiufengensis]
MALTEFEKKRQENIQRNKELLQKLNLDSITNNISKEIERSSPSPQPTTKKRKIITRNHEPKSKKEAVEPTRRSSRLRGIKTELENPEEYRKIKEEELEAEREKKKIESLRRTKLYGDFNLIDLVTDKKKGGRLFEEKIRPTMKQKANGAKIEQDETLLEEENEVLALLQSIGDKFSAGDFYEQISKNENLNSDKLVDSKRKEFDSKRIFSKFDPLDVKLTHHRITSIAFHPSTTERIVAAGDTDGNLGIWIPDSETDEKPTISISKPHGKNVSKILTPSNQLQKIYSSSYDGSVRSLDLKTLKSQDVISLNEFHDSGITDINFVREDPNLLYMTNLSGLFYNYDLRTKPNAKNLLRLHDKKVGGFAINPNNNYQIATSSLDRTLRLWDLRKISKSEYSEYDDHKSPHMYGNYTSKLSISCVDWNINNHIVCNGYADYIHLFNYNEPPKITEWDKSYMPDYKRPRVKEEDTIILPDNLKPFNSIRHNCQTGRWVSILKSRWQENPADGMHKFIIANMNRGLDIYDEKGNILAHLNDQVGAIPAVCTLHPTQNWVVGGSASGKIYLIE